MEKPLTIEVVYALRHTQVIKSIAVADGTTVAQALDYSRIFEEFPDEDLRQLAVGIWGQRVSCDALVSEGDRIELYRPLAANPRDARRELAESGRTMNQDRS